MGTPKLIAGALQKRNRLRNRHPEGDRRGASRQAPTAVASGWQRASATRAGCAQPVVAAGASKCPRDASNRLPVGLHLLRRAPGHRRRRHPGDAERQRQGHGPVSLGTLRR